MSDSSIERSHLQAVQVPRGATRVLDPVLGTTRGAGGSRNAHQLLSPGLSRGWLQWSSAVGYSEHVVGRGLMTQGSPSRWHPSAVSVGGNAGHAFRLRADSALNRSVGRCRTSDVCNHSNLFPAPWSPRRSAGIGAFRQVRPRQTCRQQEICLQQTSSPQAVRNHEYSATKDEVSEHGLHPTRAQRAGSQGPRRVDDHRHGAGRQARLAFPQGRDRRPDPGTGGRGRRLPLRVVERFAQRAAGGLGGRGGPDRRCFRRDGLRDQRGRRHFRW